MAGSLMLDMDLDDRDVRRGINGLIRSGRDLRPVFTALKKPFKDDIKAHQKRKEGPDGPWAPRAESTRSRDRNAKTTGGSKGGKTVRRFKRRRKQKLLGKLPAAVSVKANAKSFTGVSKVPWSIAHQVGAVVGRGTVLPARPFLFLSKPFLEEVDEKVLDHLEEGWKP